jgi:hypothetical protein
VIDRTRPLCPYPQEAVYTGTGSINDAANFVCRDLERWSFSPGVSRAIRGNRALWLGATPASLNEMSNAIAVLSVPNQCRTVASAPKLASARGLDT